MTADERDTLRERIAAAWSHARCSVAHDPSACSTCALFALLDSPVGEPEPDAWLVELADGWRAQADANEQVMGDGMDHACQAAAGAFRDCAADLVRAVADRRSKLPGAVISDEGETLELARQDGFVAGAFWAARYVDERDMKPTGAEISHEARAHSRMRMRADELEAGQSPAGET